MDSLRVDYFPIILSVIVIIITCIIYILLKSKLSAKRNSLLITGLCDSGKTTLYARLLTDKYINTQTSIKENIGKLNINGKNVNIIDIPGHERLRYNFLETYKTKAFGLLYVIDSTTVEKDIRDVAEYLFSILNDDVLSGTCSNLLIVCNKQDQPFAKTWSAIKTLLEKELNTLVITKRKQLKSVDKDESRKGSILVDKFGDEFKFNHYTKISIDFVNTCAIDKKSNECDLNALKKWLNVTV